MISPVDRKWWTFRVVVIALAFVLTFELFYQAPLSATSSQMVCIGLGGWPCGYTGPFTGNYFAGYAKVGCTPYPNGTCAVPQVAIKTSFLVIGNTSYVIDWANESIESSSRLVDGSTLSVLGKLDEILYNKTAGSTYMIYYSNSKGLWNPQPQLQIENASLTTQSATLTCTTTGGFPAGACSAVYEMPQQQSHIAGNTDIASWTVLLASCAVPVVIVGTLAFLRHRRTRIRPELFAWVVLRTEKLGRLAA